MPAAGWSGAGDAVRDDRIRFTSRKVPENPSVRERAGLPFGVLVQPHLPRSRDGTDASSRDAIERAVPEVVSAEDVARCTECFGYINGYCGFERDGWICILCGTFSYWPGDGGASSRYRRNPNRRLLPEIAGADIDMEVAVEHVVFDPESPVGTAPAYVALIDLTAPEHALESVKSAVLAAMEAAGDAALFGVACFDETMTVIDASNESATSMKRVAVDENGALALPLQDIMPLDAFLVPVRTHKDRIAAAVEALEPTRGRDAVGNDDAAAASTLLGEDAPSSLRLGTPIRSFRDDDDFAARDKTPSFLSTLAGSARASKKPPGRGGLLDAPSGAAGEKRGALASLVSALRGASVRDGSEENTDAFGNETAHRGQGRTSKKLGSGGWSRGARAFGPALEATLTFLGAEGVDDAVTAASGGGFRLPVAEAPRHPTCRVMAFLAGAPDLGDGAVAGREGREGRGTAGAGTTSDAADASPHAAYASSASEADDAIEPVTSFYADAGDRAALAAVAVDVFCLDTDTRGDAAGTKKTSGYLASVAPLASRSGGALFRYGAAGWDDEASAPPVPRDAFRALASERCVRERDVSMDDARAGETLGDALHCTLRVRTSAEFVVSAARGGGIVPDETYEGLFHVPRCSSLDGFAFDLEHARSRGFGRGGDCPPTAQMAFEFTRIETLFEEGLDPEEKTRDEKTNDGAAARVIGITRRRVRRVCTRQAAVASTPDDVVTSADAEATFGVVYRKILDAAEGDGVAEARELFADWLAALAAKGARESRDSRHVDLEGRNASERVDASFANAPALRRIAKWTHAALARSAALAVPGFAASCLESRRDFFSADARVAAFWTHRRLGPSALARTVYPEITAWTADGGSLETRTIDAANADEDDARVPPTPMVIPASREALIQSGGSLFVADAHDTVVAFQAPAQPGSSAALAAFPPPRASPARAFVEGARRRRAPAPSVSYVRGGAESPAPFDRVLVEEMDVALLPGGQTIFGGLEGFRRATEARARAMLQGEV